MSLEVIAGHLRDHADSIDDCLDAFSLVGGASEHVKLGTDAYGLLCSWLPPILGQKHDRFDKLVAEAKEILTDDAKALREMATEYETTDKTSAAEVEKAAGDIKHVEWA